MLLLVTLAALFEHALRTDIDRAHGAGARAGQGDGDGASGHRHRPVRQSQGPGRHVGKEKTEAASAQFYALQFGRPGAPRLWQGDKGNSGKISVGPYVRVNERDCREFTHDVTTRAGDFSKTGMACRLEGGTWETVDRSLMSGRTGSLRADKSSTRSLFLPSLAKLPECDNVLFQFHDAVELMVTMPGTANAKKTAAPSRQKHGLHRDDDVLSAAVTAFVAALDPVVVEEPVYFSFDTSISRKHL